MHQPGTECSCTSFSALPPHLQHHIFASAAAPLTTCKASAAITSDASLTAQWLLVKHKQPLLMAIKTSLWDVCSRLLSTFQYIPGREELQESLPEAAKKGSASVVEGLLQWCCKEHHQLCDICIKILAALIHATVNGHAPVVSLLIHHPAITARRAQMAVCEAAKYGHLEVLQLLITTRPDASAPGLGGRPMFAAALYGQTVAMQLLVQHGADVHNSRGSPWGTHDLEFVLFDRRFEYLPLTAAAMNGHLKAVRWLHEQGVTDAEVGQALVVAAGGGHVHVVQYLLQECRANVSLYGPDALSRAIRGRHLEVVLLLLRAGTRAGFGFEATQRFTQEQWSTILQAATQHGHA